MEDMACGLHHFSHLIVDVGRTSLSASHTRGQVQAREPVAQCTSPLDCNSLPLFQCHPSSVMMLQFCPRPRQTDAEYLVSCPIGAYGICLQPVFSLKIDSSGKTKSSARKHEISAIALLHLCRLSQQPTRDI